MKSLSLIIGVVFLFSCRNENYPESNIGSADKNLPAFKIEVYDSIKYENASMQILCDYKKDSYLFYDVFTMEIIIRGESGEELRRIGPGNSRGESYGELRALSFLDDKNIIGVSSFEYYIIQKDGNSIEKISIDSNMEILVVPQFGFNAPIYRNIKNEINALVKGGKSIKETVRDKQFFSKMKWGLVLNITTKSYITGIPYPEGSIYRTNYYSESSPQLAADPTGQNIYALFPHTPELFVHSAEDLTLKQKINLYPEQFKIKKGGEFGDDNIIQNGEIASLTSSQYQALEVYPDGVLLTFYVADVNYDGNPNTDLDELKINRRKFVQLFSREGKKLCKDILLPTDVGAIGPARIPGELLLFKKHTDDQKTETVILRARIYG